MVTTLIDMQCKCTIKFLFKYMPCTTEIVILFYFSINEVIRWPVSEERGICSSPQWAMKHPQRNIQSPPPTKATNHWWQRSCCGAQQPSLWPTVASSPSSSPPPKKNYAYTETEESVIPSQKTMMKTETTHGNTCTTPDYSLISSLWQTPERGRAHISECSLFVVGGPTR